LFRRSITLARVEQTLARELLSGFQQVRSPAHRLVPLAMHRGTCCMDLGSTTGIFTHISEETKLELKIEFYNVFNHENFWPGGISTILQSPTCGKANRAEHIQPTTTISDDDNYRDW
jgi:hypothetical protein